MIRFVFGYVVDNKPSLKHCKAYPHGDKWIVGVPDSILNSSDDSDPKWAKEAFDQMLWDSQWVDRLRADGYTEVRMEEEASFHQIEE